MAQRRCSSATLLRSLSSRPLARLGDQFSYALHHVTAGAVSCLSVCQDRGPKFPPVTIRIF
eukprot:767033-Hanusia_phi.AAC.4